MIQSLRRRGVYLRDIGEQQAGHLKTVRRALKRGGPPTGHWRRQRGRLLKPYRAQADRLLTDGVSPAASGRRRPPEAMEVGPARWQTREST